MLEPFQSGKRSQDRILHDIVGVGAGARVPRQAAPRPAFERPQGALDQNPDGRRVAVAGALEHVDSRVAQEMPAVVAPLVFRGVGGHGPS